MKFILSRTDDFRIHSKKWVVGYGLLFWLISRIVAMLLIIACVAIYKTCGIDPESQTSFIGNPETAKKNWIVYLCIDDCQYCRAITGRMHIPSWVIFQKIASGIGGILHTCVHPLATSIFPFYRHCFYLCIRNSRIVFLNLFFHY